MLGWTGVHVGVVWSELLLLMCISSRLLPSELAGWVTSHGRIQSGFEYLVRLRASSVDHCSMFKYCRSSYVTVWLLLLTTYTYYYVNCTIFCSVLGSSLRGCLTGGRGSLSGCTRRPDLAIFVWGLSWNLSLNHVILWRFQILMIVPHKILILLSVYHSIPV